MYFILKRHQIKRVLRLGFLIYLLLIGWFLFISVDSIDRSSYFQKREVHIIPFAATYTAFVNLNNDTYDISENERFHYHLLVVRNIVGNVILFLPWGFLIPSLFVRCRSLWKVSLLTLFICVLIESIQYIFILGVADVDDVIYNLGGAIMGFYLYQAVKHRFAKHLEPGALK